MLDIGYWSLFDYWCLVMGHQTNGGGISVLDVRSILQTSHLFPNF